MIYIVERKRAADFNQAVVPYLENSSSEEIKYFGPYDDENVAFAVSRSMSGISITGGMPCGSRMSTRVLRVEYRDPKEYIEHCIERQEDRIKELKKSNISNVKWAKEELEELKNLKL